MLKNHVDQIHTPTFLRTYHRMRYTALLFKGTLTHQEAKRAHEHMRAPRSTASVECSVSFACFRFFSKSICPRELFKFPPASGRHQCCKWRLSPFAPKARTERPVIGLPRVPARGGARGVNGSAVRTGSRVECSGTYLDLPKSTKRHTFCTVGRSRYGMGV